MLKWSNRSRRKRMKIELYTDLQSVTIDILDKEFNNFVKTHLDAGRSFEIFFPEYEVRV